MLATVYSQAHGPLIFQVGLGSWVWTRMCEPHGYTWTALSTIHHTTDHGASCRHTCKYIKEWLYTHAYLFQFADGCLCVLRSLKLPVQGVSIMLLHDCIVHTPMYTCTVVSQKRAHGRCTLLWVQTRGWADIFDIAELTSKKCPPMFTLPWPSTDIALQLTRGSHIRVARRSVYDRDQESWSVKIILDHLIAWFYVSSKDKT